MLVEKGLPGIRDFCLFLFLFFYFSFFFILFKKVEGSLFFFIIFNPINFRVSALQRGSQNLQAV